VTTAPSAPVSLVTGASRGIGAAISERLARDGHHLVLTARSEKELLSVDDRIHEAGGAATIAPLDLKDSEGIDRLGAAIASRFGTIDTLVLNAAILGTLSPLGHIPPKEFEEVIAVDLVAQWRMIRAFDPLLRRSRGVVVAITSSVARGGRAYWGAYAVAKAGFEALVGTYADEMTALGVRVLLVDPGGTRTGMRAKAFPGEDPKTLKTPDIVADRIAEALAAGLPRGLTRLLIAKDGSVSRSG
jgi:NAD(P)-dependent dehydrogenase (short-subunit alcohol dehydrogenase family)